MSGLLTLRADRWPRAFACRGRAALGKWAKPGPLAEEKTIVIPRNSGVSDAAEILIREGVIEDSLWFRAAMMLRGGTLQAGEFSREEECQPE